MFRNWVFDNFPFLEDDFDALTDYELFCKICSYVKEYAKDNEEMKAKIEEFQHYFDNLDVQEEINNKLDEMVEDGTLSEIINNEIFSELNTKVDNLDTKIDNVNLEVEQNKINILSDNVQSNLYKELTSLFDYDLGWSLSGVYIIGNKGIAVANDWTDSGSAGEKFNIVTFTYENNNISDIVTRYQLVDGHSNSICKLSETEVLIVAISHLYKYDLTNNTYEEINDIPTITSISEYGEYIYASNISANLLYKLKYEDDTLSIVDIKELDNLYSTLHTTQGMVIYDDKIIFFGNAPTSLLIYDLNSLEIMKNQIFTSPYLVEYEDGFIYNDILLSCDTQGRLYTLDIYGKNNIGGYYNDVITRSNTDVLLFNTPIKLNWNEDNIITFNDVMSFLNNNSNTDIGTLGSQLESISLYFAYGTAGSQSSHQMTPVEVLCFKDLINSNLKNNNNQNVLSYVKNWNCNYYDIYEGDIEKYTVYGTIDYAGGDSIPQLIITPSQYIIYENITDEQQTIIDSEISPNVNLYLLKIVGHRKVGKGY